MINFFKNLLCKPTETCALVETKEQKLINLKAKVEERIKEEEAKYHIRVTEFLEKEKAKPRFKLVFVTDLGEFETEPFEPQASFYTDRYYHSFYSNSELENLERALKYGLKTYLTQMSSRYVAEQFSHNYTVTSQYEDRYGVIQNSHPEYYHHKQSDTMIPRKEIRLIKFVEVTNEN